MNHQSGGFVDDDDLIILVDDIEGNIFRDQIRWLSRRDMHQDMFTPGKYMLAFQYDPAIDLHLA